MVTYEVTYFMIGRPVLKEKYNSKRRNVKVHFKDLKVFTVLTVLLCKLLDSVN